MMKKIVLLASILVFLSILMLSTQFVITVSGSTTHHVYPGQSIQKAMNLAQPGETIIIHAGTYFENVVVNRSVSLIGEDPATTIIDGGGRFVKVVEITANNVAIKNFTIRNDCQVLSWESNNCIYLANFNNTLIQNNIITSRGGYGGGIVVIDSSNNNISGNTIETTPNIGIRLYSTSNNVVSSNGITNSSGIELHYNSSNNVISNNTVKAYGSGNGIAVVQSFNNTVSGNTVKNMSWGIMLSWSSYNTVSKNIIANNSEYGFLTFGSSYNDISENTITVNKYDGVCLAQLSDNNTVYRNDIIDNGQAGITLSSSSYNIIFENNITNNRYGIRFVKLGEPYSNSNRLHNNNFINNTKQVHAFFQDAYSINVWDNGYPSGGNYWSDYEGVDEKSDSNQDQPGSDGVGDTAYAIDANNTDRYPLMGPINVFDVGFWNEEECNVNVVSNSTVSKFQVDKTERIVGFNVTGETGLGFCRVTIPNAIVQDLWQGNYSVLINGQPTDFRNWTDNINTYMYFTYQHSEHEVTIIPEFPTWASILLVLIVLTFAIVIYKRRLLKNNIPVKVSE